MNGSDIFGRVKKNVKANKKLREEGKDIVIPWESFPRLSKAIPGVQRGRYAIITAASKVGKTQIADALYVMEPLNYIKKYNTNLKPKIFYFSLEMSKDDKIAQLISNKIYQDTGMSIPPDKLMSYFKDYIAEDWIIELLDREDYKAYFEYLEERIEYIDWIRNPFGIYAHMREYARKNGKFFFKGQEVVIPDGITDWSKISYDHYQANDPDEIIIVITDHVSLLEQEKGMLNQMEAMMKFSSVYCLKMRDNFKYCVVNIQQQAMDSDKPEYTRDGSLIVNKLRPSTDGFGDMKRSVRDADFVFGLFNPSKYGITYYPDKTGYLIRNPKEPDKSWGNHYRELSIIVNRRGEGDLNVHLYFNGAVNYFEELEEPEVYIKNPEKITARVK